MEAIEAETAAVEAGEGRVLDIGSEPRSNKTLKVVVGALGTGEGIGINNVAMLDLIHS